MNSLLPRSGATLRRNFTLLAGLILLSTTASAHPTTPPDQKPASTEFGPGPRPSEHAVYIATLQPAQPLRGRGPQKVSLLLRDAAGQPVRGATIAVDGGMPQHGHGLPTQPRVAPTSEDGVYQIEGLRFNMGGWWELALAIDSPRGADRVVFHLQL